MPGKSMDSDRIYTTELAIPYSVFENCFQCYLVNIISDSI